MKPIKKIFSIFFLSGCLAAGWEYLAAAQDIGAGITDFSIEQAPALNLLPTENELQPDLFNPALRQKKDEIVSLRFVWNAPVNVAAFERNGKIWMVFDRPNIVDVATLKSEAGTLAEEIYTLPTPAARLSSSNRHRMSNMPCAKKACCGFWTYTPADRQNFKPKI